MSIRSKVVDLSTAPANLQLGGVRGFSLTAAASDAAATFPVVVAYRDVNGNDREILARAGKVYKLDGTVYTAVATCPTAAHSYQLDLLDSPDDYIQ